VLLAREQRARGAQAGGTLADRPQVVEPRLG